MKKCVILAALCATVAVACTKEKTSSNCLVGRKSQTVFVATDRHDVGNGNNLKALVQLASQDMSKEAPDFYFLGGDNVGTGSMADSLASPPYYLDDVYSEILAGAGLTKVDFLSTYGSHDNGCLDSYYDFFSGPRACDGYYLYGVSYAQMVYATDSSAVGYAGMDRVDSFGVSAQTASQAFLRWVSSLQDTAPIIVMSHVPIHANRADNPGGAIWASALNKAAPNHDIFLLFGHNHTTEERMGGAMAPMDTTQMQPVDSLQQQQNPLDSLQQQMPQDSLQQQGPVVNDQDYYMVLPGSKLPVQTADKTVIDTVTIQFVYMNAGYLKLGYASTIKLMDQDSDGNYDTYGITRYTVADTVITRFGNTDIPNPVYLR